MQEATLRKFNALFDTLQAVVQKVDTLQAQLAEANKRIAQLEQSSDRRRTSRDDLSEEFFSAKSFPLGSILSVARPHVKQEIHPQHQPSVVRRGSSVAERKRCASVLHHESPLSTGMRLLQDSPTDMDFVSPKIRPAKRQRLFFDSPDADVPRHVENPIITTTEDNGDDDEDDDGDDRADGDEDDASGEQDD